MIFLRQLQAVRQMFQQRSNRQKKRCRQKGRQGSITVFTSLMLMVIASLLFTLLECSRYLMLGMMSVLDSQGVTESIFAEYNIPAYQNYHLFMMDAGYGTGQLSLSKINTKMQQLSQENLNPVIAGFSRHSNFLQMDTTDSSVVRYELVTDQDASVLLQQMSEAMKSDLGVSMIEDAAGQVTDIADSINKGKEADDYLDGALDELEQAQESEESGLESYESPKAEIRSAGRARLAATADTDENPMEDIKSAKGSPLLSQILPEGQSISSKETNGADSATERELNSGNFGAEHSIGAVQKAFVMQYLKKYAANFLKKIDLPHALEYEQEYILFGKYSDEENLKKMATKMLLIREGMNFAYLLSDSVKREEAFAMATAIATASGIPFAVHAIEMGLLASWAYAESIVELRSLFSGEKIAAVKTAESWTVSLAQAAAVPFQTSIKAKPVSSGLDYQDYLLAFLLLENKKSIGMRFANLLEKNIRLSSGYENVKLDCMVTAMETEYNYHAKQAFLAFVTVSRLPNAGYRYKQKYEFSYLKESVVE